MTVQAPPPAAPPQPPLQQPPAPGNKPGRFFGWVSAHPKIAFWTTLCVALLIGIGIGASGGNSGNDKEAKTQLSRTRGELSATKARAEHAESQINDLQNQLRSANAVVKKATASGPVPDLTGGSVEDAKSTISDSGINWSVKTTSAPSDESEGTVIGQQPRQGAQLHSGRTITLTVAVPRPKQWQTIVNLQGSGEQRTNEFRIPSGVKARLNYSFGGSSNDIIEMKTPGQGSSDIGDLLFNEIGPKQGTTRLYASSGTRYLDIEGDSWSVQVQVFR